ncbi:MAG: formimidoylglutamate deiminase [Rhizobiaceae bacterium]
MTYLFAKTALLPNGWTDDVSIELLENGRIGRIETGAANVGASRKVDILLPAPVNAHSHAFQRAMAGLTEKRGPETGDSFWTWRKLMYRFLDQLNPDDIEAITTFVQMEMLEAGYATNIEFHYLHHQPSGGTYENLAETSERVIAAAAHSGIGLTLLPVHYQYGGCDKRGLGPGQIRFGNDFDRFQKLFEMASNALTSLPDDCGMGLAPHSLRAVAPSDLNKLQQLVRDKPFHMHLAEQIAEVEEVESMWDARPVEWFLDNFEVNGKCCLIHCTQMEPHETEQLARSGAIAGLCPITESSLGDGIFDGVRWVENDGAIAIGSDSNIRISLSEELRTLEYSQRLRDHSRAAMATLEKSTGRQLFDLMVAGGARAAGRDTGRISEGMIADLISLDGNAVDLAGRSGDMILDCFVFSGDDRMIKDVWSASRHQVQNGEHVARTEIVQRYRKTMTRLEDLL